VEWKPAFGLRSIRYAAGRCSIRFGIPGSASRDVTIKLCAQPFIRLQLLGDVRVERIFETRQAVTKAIRIAFEAEWQL